MIKFNDNTIETRFINNLVSHSNIPTIRAWSSGDSIFAGSLYVTRDGILRANMNGSPMATTDASDANSSLPYFTFVQPYTFEEPYLNLTSNHAAKDVGYSAQVHKALGDYLRCYKAVYGVDLMKYYNCYNGLQLSNMSFYKETVAGVDIIHVENAADTAHIYYSVPVTMGKTYNVHIETEAPAEILTVVYGKKGVIKSIQSLNDWYSDTYKLQPTVPFTEGFKYTVPVQRSGSSTYYTEIAPYEPFLRMIIKVPAGNKSSLAVIENNYSLPASAKGTCTRVISKDLEGKAKTHINSPSILETLNDGTCYACSNRLIEYLLKNVIDETDEYTENIRRIQEAVSSDKNLEQNGSRYTRKYVNGVWDKDLEEYILSLAADSSFLPIKYDLSGRVTHDVENVIMRGQKQ